MSKSSNIQKFFVISIGLSLLFINCKKSPTSLSFDEDDLIGKWILNSIEVKGSVKGQGMSITMDTTMQMPANSYYFQFFDNNKFFVVFNEDELFGGLEKTSLNGLPKKMQWSTDSGTWSLSGNQLSMTSYGDDTTIVTTISISGNSMTMSLPLKINEEGISINMDIIMFLNKQ